MPTIKTYDYCDIIHYNSRFSIKLTLKQQTNGLKNLQSLGNS